MSSSDSNYDCVIVGAGIGGLTTACLLAKAGKKVLVLEKNRYPGGYCSNFKRKGFVFESAIHAINGCGPTGRTRQILNECGVFDKTVFLKPRDVCRFVFPDIDISFQQENLASQIETLSQAFPQERENIFKFFSEMKELFEEAVSFNADQAYSQPSSLIWRNKDLSLQEFLDERFQDSRLKAVLAQYWGYLGLPPAQLSATYYLYMFWDYIANGACYPEGGSENLARKLANEIEKTGGKVMFGAEVSKFISDNGQIISRVCLKNGNEYAAGSFVSNISAKVLFENMLEGISLRKTTADRISSTKESISAFVLYLGLNQDVRALGISDYEVFLNPSYDLSNHYEAALNNDFSNTQLAVTIYSNLDKTCCVEGKSVLSVFTLSNYQPWSALSREEYRKRKLELASVLIERCAQLIPNIQSQIEFMEIATPLTLKRYSGNPDGALYGWEQNLAHSGFRRQRPATPIPNLFLTGAWTRPGGGFSSVVYSGQITANHLNKASLGIPNYAL